MFSEIDKKKIISTLHQVFLFSSQQAFGKEKSRCSLTLCESNRAFIIVLPPLATMQCHFPLLDNPIVDLFRYSIISSVFCIYGSSCSDSIEIGWLKMNGSELCWSSRRLISILSFDFHFLIYLNNFGLSFKRLTFASQKRIRIANKTQRNINCRQD